MNQKPNVESFWTETHNYPQLQYILNKTKTKNITCKKTKNKNKIEHTGLWLRTMNEMQENEEFYHFYNVVDTEKPKSQNKILTNYITSAFQSKTPILPPIRTLRLSLKSQTVLDTLKQNLIFQKYIAEWISNRIQKYALDDWYWRTFFTPSSESSLMI